MKEYYTIQEIIYEARKQIPPVLWDHITGGAESETTLYRNRQALDRIAFRQRVLRDVSSVDASSTMLGQKIKLPVFLAPIGSMNMMRPNADIMALEAAKEFGIFFWLGSVNELELESANEMGGRQWIFQLYIRGDEAWLNDYLDRINETNTAGLCLTVDTALYSRRERDLVNGFAPYGREDGDREGFRGQALITQALVEKVRKKIKIPLIIKGIQTSEDARIAVSCGADVIYVSNHGGRQLDHCPGSMDVFSEVIDAVGDQADVFVDGGFLRGSDVIKAIAMGAKAVGIGKLYALALAADGEHGLLEMLRILKIEMKINMGLLGVTSLDQLDSSYIRPARPVLETHTFNPFPSLQKELR